MTKKSQQNSNLAYYGDVLSSPEEDSYMDWFSSNTGIDDLFFLSTGMQWSSESIQQNYNLVDEPENLYQEYQNVEKTIKKRKPREKIALTPQGENFRNKYYYFLTRGTKKIARKELILQNHARIHEKYPGIRSVTREESRSIGKYFNSFAPLEYFILKALQELQNEGKISYVL
ncbi:hypothetical protein M9Y10_016292 [Tritrichomonas musculus]|uniref:Uncharacterized protein n=1 Tax=Tritrichomonas musculus TaxID=1915356 RepID=A0ABR2HVS0_9EUKA